MAKKDLLGVMRKQKADVSHESASHPLIIFKDLILSFYLLVGELCLDELAVEASDVGD